MTTHTLRAGFASVLALCALALAGEVGPDGGRADDPKAIIAARLEQFGEGYVGRYDAERRIVYVSALDDDHFRETARLLAACTDAQRKTLLAAPLPWRLTVILPTADDYAPLAPAEDVRGFYEPAERTLISVDRGRVLIHEFTHALHHAEMAAARQRHAPWVCEGIATLFEHCEIADGELAPLVGRRLIALRHTIRRDELIPLAELVTLTGEQFTDEGRRTYPEARYLLLYLHEQGKLAEWYTAYKDGFEDDPTGRRALQAVLKKPLGQIEDDWLEWIDGLELPWGEAGSDEGRLGLRFKAHRRGAEVIEVLDGGAAQRAGRIEVGDVITEFNGVEIANPAVLAAAIREAGAMQTVTVTVRRGGRKVTLRQPLGRPPQ